MSNAAAAAISETHISVLVFLGDRAYKLKKPVDMGFLDFTTREAREAACHTEVELNRRLAPDVYLGVADVLGVDGRPADHLVVMRRMPEERRLASLVALRAPDLMDQLHTIARLLADFHARAARSTEIDDAGDVEAVQANWEQSFAELQGPVGSVLDTVRAQRVQDLVRRYLAGRRSLFSARIRGGHVCDGHGDLQAADIFCLDDGPRILDCIEFCDRFRHGDVMADVGFLAMDLERLGAPDLADHLLTAYREFSGETCPASLVDHYIAYRAHVRAKVSCMRADQLEGTPREQAVQQANDLLELAVQHLERSRVRLVVVGGLPGTGKSTLALGLGDRHGWMVLRSDEIRKEIAGLDVATPAAAPFGEGLYEADTTRTVYGEMLERAGTALAMGETVVLDASWTADVHRSAARRLAETSDAELHEIQCVVAAPVAERRLVDRAGTGDASDADPGIARLMAAAAEPWPEAVVADTSRRAEDVIETVSQQLA